jgi:hypothetical protein
VKLVVIEYPHLSAHNFPLDLAAVEAPSTNG